MDPRLTDGQREVLEFIQRFTEAHGVPPTVREIGARFHVTPRAAFDHLRALERKGYLRRRSTEGRTSRALTLAARPQSVREVPILGRIAAGTPLLSEENREGALPLDPAWVGGRGEDGFGPRGRGEGMINARIVEGGHVLVRRQGHAPTTDIAVAPGAGE